MQDRGKGWLASSRPLFERSLRCLLLTDTKKLLGTDITTFELLCKFQLRVFGQSAGFAGAPKAKCCDEIHASAKIWPYPLRDGAIGSTAAFGAVNLGSSP